MKLLRLEFFKCRRRKVALDLRWPFWRLSCCGSATPLCGMEQVERVQGWHDDSFTTCCSLTR